MPATLAWTHSARSIALGGAAAAARGQPGVGHDALGGVARPSRRGRRGRRARRDVPATHAASFWARTQSTIETQGARLVWPPARPGVACAARRDDGRAGHEVERQARRLGAAGKATWPPASRDDEGRRGGVEGAAVAQRDHPVDARGRHLAQRDRRRARSPAAGGRRRRGRRSPGRPSAGRPTRSARISRRPLPVAALGQPGRGRAPSSVRPRRRGGRSTPRRGRSRARSRRPRRRPSAPSATAIDSAWWRQPALGVQRAVDRVDDDARAASPPKSISPRSSETAVKRCPPSCSASSSAKTLSSAAASIADGHVAALAPPHLAGALGRRRRRPRALPDAARRRGGRRRARSGASECAMPALSLQPCAEARTASDQRRVATHPGGPLLVLGGRGHRQDAARWPRASATLVAGRDGAGADPRADRHPRRRGGAARPRRGRTWPTAPTRSSR